MAESSKFYRWSYSLELFDSSDMADIPQKVSVYRASDTVEEGVFYRVSVANGASDMRLDPFVNVGVDLETLEAFIVESDQTVTLRIGLVTATARTLTAPSGGKAWNAGTETITRSATVGLWISNASGSVANVKLLYVGT